KTPRLYAARAAVRALRGENAPRLARAGSVDRTDRAVSQRPALPRTARACEAMRESRLPRVFLRHLEESQRPLVQQEMRQSGARRRALPAATLCRLMGVLRYLRRRVPRKEYLRLKVPSPVFGHR